MAQHLIKGKSCISVDQPRFVFQSVAIVMSFQLSRTETGSTSRTIFRSRRSSKYPDEPYLRNLLEYLDIAVKHTKE